MSTLPVGVGVIGTGSMGNGHIRTVNYVPETRLVAIADSSDEQVRSGLAAAGREVPAFTDYRKLLERTDVEAVIVATPAHLHATMTVDALRAGKHVLCEKAMALSLPECDAMLAAARASGKVMQIGLELRCAPLYQKLHELAAAGRIGALRMLWCHEFRLPFFRKTGDWMVQKRFSGGTLVEKNCHHFDLFNWLAGAPPVRVAAFGGSDAVYARGGRNELMEEIWSGHRDPETEIDVLDNAWVLVEYANGVRACLGLCMFSPHGNDILSFGVLGSRGQLRSSESQYQIEEFNLRDGDSAVYRPHVPSAEKRMSHRGATLAAFRAFARAVREDGAVPVTGEAGKLSLAVSLAAEKAVAEKRIVEVGEILP